MAIGSTQITKSGKFPTGGSGDNIPDLDLVAGDDHAVNEEFDELALLVKGGMLKRRLNALTESLQVVDIPGEFELAIRPRGQLLGLVVEGLPLGL
jgi:hypothetical protein